MPKLLAIFNTIKSQPRGSESGRVMSIKLVDESMWPGILRVQSEVYLQVAPESIDVLRSKWNQSPESCFVYQEDNNILGYLLAHIWNEDTPPKLFQPLPEQSRKSGSVLFLHDLAVSTQASGKGIGSKMVNNLFNVAIRQNFTQIRLVAVQDSFSFWSKMGFTETANHRVCSSYGNGARLMRCVI